MSENQYFVTKLNKLGAENVKAKSTDAGVEVFIMKAVSKIIASVNNILNDDFVYEVRQAKVNGVETQILYGLSTNPTKSNKGAKSSAEKADEIEIELI
jgi:hypothetical protein